MLEYADVVWDNITSEQVGILEKLQLECLRIITGLPRFSSSAALYQETGLYPLSDRRRQHRLTSLFKIINSACPEYLHSIVPHFRTVNNARNNRNLYTFTPINCRIELFKQSFIPKSCSEWNLLSSSTRALTNLPLFKKAISNHDQDRPSLLFENYSPLITRNYTRLKFSCSNLNADLFRVNLVTSPTCACRTGIEDCFHFLYNCPYYDVQRELMINDLTNLGVIDLRVESLMICEIFYPPEIALEIQRIILKYIMRTGRF